MIAAAILLSSLAPAVSAAPYVMPPVAGVCTGNAGVGVGCGFDGSKSTAFGLTTAPKKSVLDIPWCDEKCYATCPPTYPIPYECEDCVYQDGEGKCFRNPYNVQSVAAPTQGGCYESKVADDTEHYDEMTKKHSSHSSGFFFHHTNSKTVKKIYQMYFEKNYSVALAYKYVLEHSVTLVPTPNKGPAPSREFRVAAQLLPRTYQKEDYRRFIDTFGTHYMSQAFMGGSALLTNYFHSCFLHTFKEKEVSKASSSSFFSIYHDNKASGWGSIIDKQKWDTWSEIDLKLSGGNASEYGTLGQDNIMGELNVASWQSTINAHTAVPLTYTLRPITEILTDDWIDPAIAKNVLQALKDYDAEITVEMKDLETSLVEKDKYKLPSWCKAPKKPHVKKGFLTIKSLSDSSLPEITSARQLRGSQPLAQEADLPGCPALPPIPHLKASKARRLGSPRGRSLAPSATPSAVAPVPALLSAAGDFGSLFGRGYDPVESEPRAAIAEWHYDGWSCKGKKARGSKPCATPSDLAQANMWVDPSSGLTFGKPDEIQLFNNPASEMEGGFKMFLDSKSYTKWHWSMHSTSVGLGFFDYSHIKIDAHLKQILDTKTATIAVKNRREIAYQMTMFNADVLNCEMQGTCEPTGEPGTQQNSNFALQRAALPTACAKGSDGAKQYALFRQAYGTHYVESAVYGGSIQFVLVIDTELYTKMTLSAIAEETSIGFNLIFAQFDMFHGKANVQQDVSTEFREHTKVVLLSTGGNPLYLEEQDYSEWASSVPTNPAPIDVTFRNVTDLFQGEKQKCMEQEVKTYLQANHTPRYRCGNAVGTKIINGVPKPKKHVLGALPTLESVNLALERRRQQRNGKASEKDESNSHDSNSAATSMMAGMADMALAALEDSTACDPERVIPGASSNDLVGKTFDLKSGEPRLLAAKMTCAKNKVWYSPFTKTMVQIPDQVDFVDTSSGCSREDMNIISDATSAWKVAAEAYGFYVGLSLPIADATLKIGYGFEKFMMNTKTLLKNYTRTQSSLVRDMSMYRLTFGSSSAGPPALTGELKMALDNLPSISGGYAKGTSKQRGMYDTFIKAFGTHYVAGADFGAHCEFTTSLSKSFVSEKTTSYIQEQMGISIGLQMAGIGIAVDLGYEEIKSAMKQDSDFEKHSQSAAACSGGDLSLLDQKPPQYDKWVESVYRAPNWINGSAVLRPLGDLIVGKDAANKRDCLKDAVISYMGEK